MSILRLDPADLHAKDSILDVLVRSFSQEEFLIQLYDGSPRLMRLAQLTKLESGLEVGEVQYLSLEGVIVSVAIWTGPGRVLSDSQAGRVLMEEVNAGLSPESRKWEQSVFDGPTKLRNERAPQASKITWYCHAIGTLPEHQGKGYAKRLLAHKEEQARREAKRMALLGISRANIDYVYKRAGFVPVVEEIFMLKDGTERPYCFMIHDCGQAEGNLQRDRSS